MTAKELIEVLGAFDTDHEVFFIDDGQRCSVDRVIPTEVWESTDKSKPALIIDGDPA